MLSITSCVAVRSGSAKKSLDAMEVLIVEFYAEILSYNALMHIIMLQLQSFHVISIDYPASPIHHTVSPSHVRTFRKKRLLERKAHFGKWMLVWKHVELRGPMVC